MQPWLLGLIRALVLALVGAAIAYLGVFPLPGEYAVYTGILIAVLREVEAIYDQVKKPDQNA